LILFIKPDFLAPVTAGVHDFGRFSIGEVGLSIGGLAAIICFFGLIGAGVRQARS
jgi:hypothetical protein